MEADERRQIINLLSLSDTSAESAMTPRVNVEFVSRDMTLSEVCEFFMNTSHTRMPVCGDTTDDVQHVITFREAFRYKQDGLGDSRLENLPLEKIMKVPLTQMLDSLFEQFQKSRRHMALVLDEHGGTAGVVTMEDILEEVFGDIKDEKDEEAIYIQRRGENTLEVVASVLIEDILEEFNYHFDELGIPNVYCGESLSYVILAEKEVFPNVGEKVTFIGKEKTLCLTVTKLDGSTIESIECVLSDSV